MTAPDFAALMSLRSPAESRGTAPLGETLDWLGAFLDTYGSIRTMRLVVERFNCRTVNVDRSLGVWIENPQRGHWLKGEDLEDFLDWAGTVDDAS